jgi:putative nucleotidyltransferase with HDIG domain
MANKSIVYYINTLFILSVVLIIFVIQYMGVTIDVIGIIPLLSLAIIAEFLKVKIIMYRTNETVSISWTLVITIATLISFGILEALLINFISAIITSIYPKRLPYLKMLYNISSNLLTVLITGIIFSLTFSQSQLQLDEQMMNVLYFCSIALFYVVINYSLGTFLMKLVTNLSLKSVITDVILPHFPHSIMLALIGALLGTTYPYNAVISLLISLVLIWLLLYSLKSAATAASIRIKELTLSKENSDKLASQLDKTFDEFIETLTATIDARDQYMFGHSTQVAHYAVAIAEGLKLPKDEIEKIRIAGLLHDIGKIFIPEEILFKEGPLTIEEYETIKKHPEIGEEIISQVSSLHDVAKLIGMHHERFDGNGYPLGLKGEDVPLSAYIIGASDALEAMISDRSYQRGKSVQEAMNELKRCKGKQFHPLVIDALFKLREQLGDHAFKNSAIMVENSKIVGKLKTNRKLNLKPLRKTENI